MCGIIGYFGKQKSAPLLLEGLKRVEYRGYDSAGIAVLGNGVIQVVKKQGKISALEQALKETTVADDGVGIGHTRWATHGVPSDRNAHPHVSCTGGLAIVHNGTIDNFLELRTMLEREGHTFSSETDTEVLAHLLEKLLLQEKDLVRAVQEMHELVHGAYGIAVITNETPRRLVAARNGSPLVVGIVHHGIFVASDATAFREQTDRVIYLEDGEMVECSDDGYRVLTLSNEAVKKNIEQLSWSLEEIAKGGHPHFMLKEIYEQPEALRRTLSGRVRDNDLGIYLGGFPVLAPFFKDTMNRIILTACGTSWHACLIGKRMLEKLLRLPVTVEYASELATAPTVLDERTLLLTVTQSGETKDTLEASKKAREQGAKVWNICNVVGSSMTRLADSGMYLRVGPEIGVASTKAFTAQVAALALLTLKLVEARTPHWVTNEGRRAILSALLAIPEQVEMVLTHAEEVARLAKEYQHATNALYLGRGYNFPTALEGALKLKEISYVHAEGYPAGEMKHGPIALIDAAMPVVVIAPLEGEDEKTYSKVMSNIEEVAARGGRILLIASEGDSRALAFRNTGRVQYVLTIPQTLAMFTPILASVYLQLFAYESAVLRGCDVDQPRNLAKSVTVE